MSLGRGLFGGGGGRRMGRFGRTGGSFKPTFKKRWGMGSKTKGKSGGGFFSKKAKPTSKGKTGTGAKGTGAGKGTAAAGAGVGAAGARGGVVNHHTHIHQPGFFGGFGLWHLPFFMNWRCRAVNPEGYRCGGSTGLFSSYCEFHRDGKWRTKAGMNTPKKQEE